MKFIRCLFTFFLITTSFSYADQPINLTSKKLQTTEQTDIYSLNSEKIETTDEQLINQIQDPELNSEQKKKAVANYKATVSQEAVRNHKVKEYKKSISFLRTALFLSREFLMPVTEEILEEISPNEELIDRLANNELTKEDEKLLEAIFNTVINKHQDIFYD